MTCRSGKVEKWLRILTSLGALYLESATYGAVFPLLPDLEWASTRPAVSSNATGQTELLESPAVGAIFVSSGVCEFLLSPIAGLLADRLGFDAVVSFGLLVLSVKCLLYGLLDTTIVTVSVGRLLQGVAGACLQPIGIARITDL